MAEVQVGWWRRFRAASARFGVTLLGFVSFAAPFAVSLAANVTAGLHSGSRVLLVAGIAIPVLLMLAIEMWRRMPPTTGRAALALRSVAMGAPVAVAAGWSWLDTTSLLLAQFHEPWWAQRVLCFLAPLAVDGLAVLSVLSLRADATPSSTTSQTSTPPASQETDTPDAAPDTSWGGPDAVDAPAASDVPSEPVSVSDPPPARVTPMRRTSTALSGRSMEHVPGWREHMIVAVLPPGVKPASDKGVRLRAGALTPRVTQNGKTHLDRRRDVERAELARARADDEEPEVAAS